jgi:hypothetical protein
VVQFENLMNHNEHERISRKDAGGAKKNSFSSLRLCAFAGNFSFRL